MFLRRWSTTGNGTTSNGMTGNGTTSNADLLTSPNIVNKSDVICTTPLNNNNNNNNGSPSKADDFVAGVLGVPQIVLARADSSPQVGDQTQAENSTAFASLNSEVFTSSPNADPEQFQMLTINERDLVVMVVIFRLLNICNNNTFLSSFSQNLRQIRNNIDATLTKLDFNSTRNITDSSMATPRPTAPPLLSADPTDKSRRHSISITSSISRRSTGSALPPVMSRVGSIRRPLISAAAVVTKRPPLPTSRTPVINKTPEPQIDTPNSASRTTTINSLASTNRTAKPGPSRSASTLNTTASRERLNSLSKQSSVTSKVATPKLTVQPKENTPITRGLTKHSSMSKLPSTSKAGPVRPTTSKP